MKLRVLFYRLSLSYYHEFDSSENVQSSAKFMIC